jgi:hypothetical protein
MQNMIANHTCRGHACSLRVVPCTMQFLDGATLAGIMALNKVTRKAIADETHIYTVDNPKFIHGDGAPALVSSCATTARFTDPCHLRTTSCS